ncbi:hypothetical protein DFH08DRAFT_900553 [Mycena albidolilacea]|uniref:MYND-type domain-containing protein n=1 Tax=Mycena albidolilacea TaxID=1033008 RepID=A0AAD6Z4Z9_9AGAR|nr:hypothetical protein DFH08DRAFT_900553 [Mycena albidolilacea]
MPPQPTEMCENCTVRRIDLRRCAGCGHVRYCSKECQKAHWKQHKPYCTGNIEIAKEAAALGPDCSDRLRAIGKWSEAFSVAIGSASVSALDIMTHPERIDEYVLVIFVNFLGAGAKPPFTHDVVGAEVVLLHDLRAMARLVSQEQLELLDRDLAPRPGMIRVLLSDSRLPWSYTTPFAVPEDIGTWPRDQLWLQHLQIRVTRPRHTSRRVRLAHSSQIE